MHPLSPREGSIESISFKIHQVYFNMVYDDFDFLSPQGHWCWKCNQNSSCRWWFCNIWRTQRKSQKVSPISYSFRYKIMWKYTYFLQSKIFWCGDRSFLPFLSKWSSNLTNNSWWRWSQSKASESYKNKTYGNWVSKYLEWWKLP